MFGLLGTQHPVKRNRLSRNDSGTLSGISVSSLREDPGARLAKRRGGDRDGSAFDLAYLRSSIFGPPLSLLPRKLRREEGSRAPGIGFGTGFGPRYRVPKSLLFSWGPISLGPRSHVFREAATSAGGVLGSREGRILLFAKIICTVRLG